MNKQEFLTAITYGLGGLPREDVARWVEYYDEILSDRIEDGMSEQDAVAAMGKPGEVVEEIIAQTPIRALVKERVRPRHRLVVWEILLIALGSPIWLSLALSAFAVILSVFAVLWSLVLSVWACEASMLVTGPAGILVAVLKLCTGSPYQAFFLLGCSLAVMGSALLGIPLCKAFTRLMAYCSKKFLLLLKLMLVGREGN